MSDTASGAAEAPLFEARIIPHRSLSRQGLRWLMAGFVGCAVLVGVRFWVLGAWPVVLFSGVEIPLAAVLLWLNSRRARASELILLDHTALRVLRTDPSGRRRETALSSAWLNVHLQDRPGRTPRLMLGHRTQWEEVGATLGEVEKRDLARALRDALYQARNPRFENPQLQG